MPSTPHGWQILDAKLPVLTFEYSFGPGLATSLAVGVDGGIAVVSPPYKAAPGVYDDLSPYGDVKALIGSNSFHYMGLAAWKARFPNASLFAPAQSIARITARSKLTGIQPLAGAASLAKHLELLDMPHYRTGELLVRIATGDRPLWYVTDVLLNLPSLPPQLLFKLLFKLTNTAPGLKFNNMASSFMVKDKRALKSWLLDQATTAPPARVLVAHGHHFDGSPDARELRTLLEA
jgi:hypothetical protein